MFKIRNFPNNFPIVLIGQEGVKVRMILSTSPVAAAVFYTRYVSRAVNEHERAHEDVPMVAEPTVLVSLAPKQTGDLLSFTQRGQISDDASLGKGKTSANMAIIRNLNNITGV